MTAPGRLVPGLLFALACSGSRPATAAATTEPATRYTPPQGILAGYVRTTRLDTALRLHVAVELQSPDPSLERTALAVLDPSSPMHRMHLDAVAFARAYGRDESDIEPLVALLRRSGAQNLYVSQSRLVVGADLSIGQAERAFHTRYELWERGERSIVAPVLPLQLPVDHVRAVRGIIKAFTPRLADVATAPAVLRGNWYSVADFRQAYDAAPSGGAGMRITVIEDASDRADTADIGLFADRAGAVDNPPDAARVSQSTIVPQIPEQVCGRDDRGQEPTLDVDALLTLAPLAAISVRYDEVCVRGGEGVVEVQRAIDATPAPDVVVFPFAVAPLRGTIASTFGPIPTPYLEAALRGIVTIVPSGDDGAYGIHEPGVDEPAVTYPCALSVVICAGGTQLGERSGGFDEGPWNDGTHASGGGVSFEPRPSWQSPTAAFSIRTVVKHRMVPDVAADAAGRLLIDWHGYAEGGVGGTSESAALVAAQIATIDGAVPPAARIVGPGDLYELAIDHPEAFRDTLRENDRSYTDNTLRPERLMPSAIQRGILPTPAPVVHGCGDVQPHGCTVLPGYDPVTGLGALLERAAIAALGGISSPSPAPHAPS